MLALKVVLGLAGNGLAAVVRGLAFPSVRQGVVQAAERHAVQVAALAVAVVAAANPVILSHSNANNVN